MVALINEKTEGLVSTQNQAVLRLDQRNEEIDQQLR